MKIQLGQIVMNRTKKYLAPCLKVYGETFTKKIHGVFKVAMGVGDIITVKSNILFEKHIFILCQVNSVAFPPFLKWIKDQEMYEEDYAFDDISSGVLHMVIIKLPEQCYETYETFKRSEFSHMYSKQDLERFFDQKSDVIKILIKDHNYKMEFSMYLQKEFNVDINPEEITDDFELDIPWLEHEEIFNTEIK
jgi:hypothetical protein